MDYKNTLNIPKTGFEMKANLPQKEPRIRERWLQSGLNARLRAAFGDRKTKVLHDGPPYANGRLHVGHALNKILKDVVLRSWMLDGYNVWYVPGWDAHGLPIEHAVSQKTKDYNALPPAKKRGLCLEYAKQQIAEQKSGFAAFGLLTDFSDCYHTFDAQYEADQLALFATMVKRGLVYQALKPIYWSWSSRSALAEAEIEYADAKAKSVYVSFDAVNPEGFGLPAKTKLLVWTTTPWTVPANQAICANPKLAYALVAADGQRFVAAKDLLGRLAVELGWKDWRIEKEFGGETLKGLRYAHSLYPGTVNPVLLAEYVKATDGTGLVHCAPGFGPDDYAACAANGINELVVHVDDAGKVATDFFDREIAGKFYLDANEPICARLRGSGHLHAATEIVHSEPHDWRTKKPVIYRATKQWFISVAKIAKELETNVDSVAFQSEHDRIRLLNMVARRTDWCISRQRAWGVPIPIVYGPGGEPVMDPELIENAVAKISACGTDAWFEKPVEFFLTPKYLSTGQTYAKERDTMDVWFDSGSSYNVMRRHGLRPRATLYLEGLDQYRGWFNSSMICSTIQNGAAPYEQLLAHGFTLDENGMKMSKSLGNVIDPLDICARYGADVLRLWACSVDYFGDNRIGEQILGQVAELYRKIRNTLFRYPLANLGDFDFAPFASHSFALADLMVVAKVNENLRAIDALRQKYHFHSALKIVGAQIADLSSWYFDLIKDALYCDAKKSARRKAAQATLNYIFFHYLLRLSAILPHTCEEAHDHYGAPNKPASVFLNELPPLEPVPDAARLVGHYDAFMRLKDDVYAQCERLRAQKAISKNNEAEITLPQRAIDLRAPWAPHLKQWLNVAEVRIDPRADRIVAAKSALARCERCWTHYAADGFANAELCRRCADAIALDA